MNEIQISKTFLAHQYETMRVTDIADYYGVCLDRLYKILDECGIERKRIRRKKREIPRVVIKG